jgi:hypothetical protein
MMLTPLLYIPCCAVLHTAVYAFGILMWEILTCRLPFEGMTYREMMEVGEEGHFHSPGVLV